MLTAFRADCIVAGGSVNNTLTSQYPLICKPGIRRYIQQKMRSLLRAGLQGCQIDSSIPIPMLDLFGLRGG